MNSKSKDKLLNSKDYLFLTICLTLFFVGGSYFLAGGEIPRNRNFIYLWGAVALIAIPTALYVLKKLSDEH